jgi:hypothetical protein
MTKFTATFKSGKQITKTTADGFRNRLDFYNWICENRLGKTYGSLMEITCRPYGN